MGGTQKYGSQPIVPSIIFCFFSYHLHLSTFARSSLIYLQEVGTLKATYPHKSERSGLTSCLFFTVLNGDGGLVIWESYELTTGDCAFIDCRKPYSHITLRITSNVGVKNGAGSVETCGPSVVPFLRTQYESNLPKISGAWRATSV